MFSSENDTRCFLSMLGNPVGGPCTTPHAKSLRYKSRFCF